MHFRLKMKLLNDIRDAVKTGKRTSYIVFSTSELMENLLSAVMYQRVRVNTFTYPFFFVLFLADVSDIITLRVFCTADPEEQPHVSGRGVRVSVASVDRQPNVQGRYIGGDARVRHHQSQTGIVSAYILGAVVSSHQ